MLDYREKCETKNVRCSHSPKLLHELLYEDSYAMRGHIGLCYDCCYLGYCKLVGHAYQETAQYHSFHPEEPL